MEPFSIAGTSMTGVEILQPIVRRCTGYNGNVEYTQACIDTLLTKTEGFEDKLETSTNLPISHELKKKCFEKLNKVHAIKRQLLKLESKYSSSSHQRTISTLTGSDEKKLATLEKELDGIESWLNLKAADLQTIPQQPEFVYHDNGDLWWQ